MSLIIEGNDYLYAFSNSIRQNYYMSNYYALTNENVFIEYKNPINANLNEFFYLSGYLTNFGDSDDVFFSLPNDIVYHKYQSEGSYYVSYSAVYVDVFVGETQINKISKSIDNINTIILNIDNTPNSTPSGQLSDASYQVAKQNILKYKQELQLQVVEYAKETFPTAMGSNPTLSAKCFRDMGYIIDAIAADIGNNANHRSIEVGSMYFQTNLLVNTPPFTNSSVPTLPQSEVQATIACINILKNYINGINIPSSPTPFTTTGILSSTEEGSTRQQDVEERIANVIYPLENNGSVNTYSPQGDPNSVDLAVANLLLLNKSKIQKEVSQYVVEKRYLSNQALINKCNRDIGLIIDSIAHDLQYGVTSRSIQYGLVYWEGSTSRLKETTTPNHKQKTVDAINKMFEVIQTILLDSGYNDKVYEYVTDIPFNIKSNWEIYDPSNVRLNDEIILDLPYNLNEVEIQPNEWGDEDIFNTSISRLQENLDYLISKTQTINTFSPTIFFGWLGNNSGTKASVVKWFTQSYNSSYLYNSDLAESKGGSYFTYVNDVASVDTYFGEVLYVLDNKNLRLFLNQSNPIEVTSTNGDVLSAFLTEPSSIAVSKDGTNIYICDKIQNSVYKINLEKTETDLNLNLQLFVGGFGGLRDNNSFNSPSQISFKFEKLYVLDYNNYGVKVFNKDLNWIHTYYIDDFLNNRPISVDVLENGLVYILTENYKVYIFDGFTNSVFESFEINETRDESSLIKILFDSNSNFVHILTQNNLYKFTLAGSYVTTFIIQKSEEIKLTNVRIGTNNTLYVSSPKCIFKIQDILQVYRLGEGLPQKYWDLNQLKVNKNEFASDINYNRSLLRIAQNIISFRNTLNARFIIATENIKNNTITYFSYLPVEERPEILQDILDLNVGVGVNELHIPIVFNKEIKKLHFSLQQLANFLSIKNYVVQNSECIDSFCWSWNSTSCYELKLPVLKTCTINPISYQEIVIGSQGFMKYAPTFTWEKAISKCCKKR